MKYYRMYFLVMSLFVGATNQEISGELEPCDLLDIKIFNKKAIPDVLKNEEDCVYFYAFDYGGISDLDIKRSDLQDTADYYTWRKEFCAYKDEYSNHDCFANFYDCGCDDEGIHMNCEEKNLTLPPLQINRKVAFSNLKGNQIGINWTNTTFLDYHHVLYLNLDDNKIKNLLPNTIPDVYVLEISFNEISKLESNSFRPRLRNLIFTHNRLTELTDNVFEKTPHLQHLDFKGNQITTLGKRTFSNLMKLQYLSLKNNNISFLPSDIYQNLSELVVLNLSNNSISEIQHKTFSTTKKLKYLNLPHNKLTTLQWVEFDDLKSIQELNLADNQIFNLECGNSNGNITIHKLNLTCNSLTTLKRSSFMCQKFIQITELYIRHNRIHIIENGTFEGMQNITILELSFNKLTTLEWNIFRNLPILEELHLDNNDIVKITNDGTIVMPQLRIINLYRNNLTTLQRSSFEFEKTAEFISIYLNKNQIYDIEEGAFQINQDYIRIYLQDNRLDKVRSNTFLINRTTRLNKFCNAPNDDGGFIQKRCLKFILDLDCNNISNLEMNFINNTQLEKIFIEQPCFSLWRNRLTEIQQSLYLGRSFTNLILVRMNVKMLNSYTFQGVENILNLFLHSNKITSIEQLTFNHAGFNVTNILTLSNNKLQNLTSEMFSGMNALKNLHLDWNEIAIIENNSFSGLRKLYHLDLNDNKLTKLEGNTFVGLNSLVILQLENNQINSIENQCFSKMSHLNELYLSNNRLLEMKDQIFFGLHYLLILKLDGNDIREIEGNILQDSPALRILDVDEFRICCLAKNANCSASQDEFSTCDDLMGNTTLKICIWIMGGIAIICNIYVIVIRSRTSANEMSRIHAFLIQNLALSDLLMGVYLLIIAATDFYYRGEYFLYAHKWRTSYECKLSGFLATFSSELTVFTLTVITLERLLSIAFPFQMLLRSINTTRFIMAVVWILTAVMALLPIYLFSSSKYGFYGRSAVCLPLHITQEKPEGYMYSVYVFIFLNAAAFVTIALGYLLMYIIVNNKRSKPLSRNRSEQKTMAFRMTLLTSANAACWLPIIVLGIRSLYGYSMKPAVYPWITVFVLPLNASLNPILYTLSSVLEIKIRSPLILRNPFYKETNTSIVDSDSKRRTRSITSN